MFASPIFLQAVTRLIKMCSPIPHAPQFLPVLLNYKLTSGGSMP